MATVGTRGDVQPPLALARTLKAAGHEVTLAAPPDFVSWIESHGVRGLGLGIDFMRWAESNRHTVGSVGAVMREVFRVLRDNVREEFALLDDELARHDILVSSSLVSAAPTVAASAGKPYVQLAFVPTIIPSPLHAPFFVPWRNLPSVVNRWAWGIAHAGFDRPLRAPLNVERQKRGLPPIAHVLDHLMAGHVILAADEVLTSSSVAGRLGVHQVPALVLDDAVDLSPDMERFLESGPPPVFIGFGSMPEADPAGLAAMIAGAVADAGVRAVVSRTAAEGLSPSSTLAIAGAEPHGRLFPRCAAVVHHGGVGTTTTALRAGVPQLIVPHTADQPDWGHRVHRAGLGPRPIPRARLRRQNLAAALTLLSTSSLVTAAREAAARTVRSGNADAMAALEAIVAGAAR